MPQGRAGDPAWHHQRAQAAFERKDYEAAAAEWEKIVALMPEAAEARSNLGLMYQLQNKHEPAIREFEHALRLNPNLASARVFLGINYYLVSRPALAIEHLEQGRALDPNSPVACKWLAMSYLLEGRVQSTISELKKCQQLDPNDHELTFFLGRAYLKHSAAAFQALRTEGSETPWFFLLRGRQFTNQEMFGDAVAEFRHGARLDPYLPGIHLEIGKALQAKGDLLGAGGAYIAELRNHPSHTRAAVRLINVLLRLGFHEQADRARMLARQRHQGNETALRMLASSPAGDEGVPFPPAGDSDRKVFQAFLDAQPPSLEPVTPDQIVLATLLSGDAQGALRLADAPELGARRTYWKARALLEQGRLEEAHKEFSSLWSRQRAAPELAYYVQLCSERLSFQALEAFAAKQPRSYRLHQLRAEYLAARNQADQAIEQYRKALELKPGATLIHLAIGDLRLEKNDYAGALAAFAAELENDPYSVAALTKAGAVHSSQGEFGQAEELLVKALSVDPQSAAAHKALGKNYFEKGDFQRSVEHMELALAYGTDDDEAVYYHLGRAHQRLGNKEEATKNLAKLKDLQRHKRERAAQRLEGSMREQAEPP